MQQKWPNAQLYNFAVQNPRQCFADPQIQQAKPELLPTGVPKPRTGTFASVYRMQTGSGDFAIRCFLKQFDDQQVRYAAISKCLRTAHLPFTVGFDFIEKGILVNGCWYPILRMDWIKGESLYSYVKHNLRNRVKLLALASQVIEIMQRLRDREIAHCDLQNGNILVSSDRLILIDYDGMYVPELKGRASHEQGHRNFQHPSRTATDYGPTIDNFSGWVIYTSLLAFAMDPTLWDVSGAAGNEDQLLFTRDDFRSPSTSPTLKYLTKHSNPDVSALASFFQSVLHFDVDQVPPVDGAGISPSGPTSTVKPGTKPSWLQSYLVANASQPAIQQQQTAQSVGSSWIFESLVGSEQVAAKTFSASQVIPRIVIALSLLCAIAAVILISTNPTIALIVTAGMIFVVALSLIVLIVFYDNDPAVKEARQVLAEQKDLTQKLNATKSDLQSAEDSKANIQKRHMKGIEMLDEQLNTEKRKEEAEIDSETKKFKNTQIDINGRRTKLSQLEAQAQNSLQSSSTSTRIRTVNSTIHNLPSDESHELSSALRSIQNQHIESYLKLQYITNAYIPGIGPKLTQRLATCGYVTAYDITCSIHGVEGIGQAKGSALEGWRRACEAAARATMPCSIPQSAVNKIWSKYIALKSSLQQELKTLQSRIEADERALRDRYAAEREKLNQEENLVQQQQHKAVKSIQLRFAQEYSRIEQQTVQATERMNTDLSQVCEIIKEIQKEMFAINLSLAKAKRKLGPYRRLTFRHYVKAVITNKAA